MRFEGKYDRSFWGFDPEFGDPQSRGWTGITNVFSSRVDIAAAAVNSDSYVFVTARALVSPNVGIPSVVTSINPGVGFTISQANSFVMVGSGQVFWFIANGRGV